MSVIPELWRVLFGRDLPRRDYSEILLNIYRARDQVRHALLRGDYASAESFAAVLESEVQALRGWIKTNRKDG